MKATYKDHTSLVHLLLQWLGETAIKDFPKDCNHSGVWIADLIAKHLVLIATLGDKLIGAIALRFGYLPWNNEVPILFNEFLMTDKKYRKTGVTDKLIQAAKDFADTSKMFLMVGHFSGTDPELKDRFIKMRGFKYIGANYVYKGE